MSSCDAQDQFKIDPAQLPKQIEVDLPPEVVERLMRVSAMSGRSVDELILEVLGRVPLRGVNPEARLP
jgi:hypothetical protein